ncbi:hypothetical protein BUALT_Bualt10G0109000 [Buddleja alternifolia]|uniref:Uncharacterized protein n=1 Tax=Buddleja alternifolia TaxID=168488 RepID=A0AAV6X6E1_9LAMI|nr:hypothetical protein BUALT_Bualt10G0109000 [Buddleja alternifolia]
MSMKGRSNARAAGRVVAVLVVLVLDTSVHAENTSTYACWGGCYNQCFPRNGGTQTQTSPNCYYNCLSSCFPRSPDDFENYCEIGCSLKRCIPVSYDGARLESCFGLCTNICKQLLKFVAP